MTGRPVRARARSTRPSLDELMEHAWDLFEAGLGHEKTWPAKDGSERTTVVVDLKASLRVLEVMGRWMGYDAAASKDVVEQRDPQRVAELRERAMAWLLEDPESREKLAKKLEGK
jgi:hypothetical protein